MSKLSYKYRLYPKKEQEIILHNNFNFCCFLYNSALEEKISHYKKYGIGISYNQQASELKEVKKFFQEQTKTIYSQSFQQVLIRLETSFQNFFRRCKNKDKKAGFPRFRSKDMFKSIVFPQSDLHGFGVKLLENNKVNIFGVGEVKVEWHRPFQGRCKQVILKREHNKFYLILSCDEVPNNILPKTGNTVAIDLGLNSFITTDDGKQFKHPKPYKTSKEKLAYKAQKLAAKQQGSNNRKKAKQQLNKCYEKISNQRNDFLHKITNKLVKENDVIIIEKLNVKKMIESEKTSLCAKQPFSSPKNYNITDASWARFACLLTYKAERAGRLVIEVDPKNTSKMCSKCNNINTEQTLSDRIYNCKCCNFQLDRDHNAAINIKKLGMSYVNAASPQEQKPSASC
jgi:putative transposase